MLARKPCARSRVMLMRRARDRRLTDSDETAVSLTCWLGGWTIWTIVVLPAGWSCGRGCGCGCGWITTGGPGGPGPAREAGGGEVPGPQREGGVGGADGVVDDPQRRGPRAGLRRRERHVDRAARADGQ